LPGPRRLRVRKGPKQMPHQSFKRNCHRFRGMISPYIDGRITDEERQALESHLTSCQGCLRELESLRTTVRLLHRLPMAVVPRSFTVAETRPAAVPPAFGWLRWATVVAVLVLVVISVGDLFHIYPEKGALPPEMHIVAVSPTPGSQQMPLAAGVPTPAPRAAVPPGYEGKGSKGTPALVSPGGQTEVMPTPTPSPATGTSEGMFGVSVTNSRAGAETAERAYRWPVHRAELAVLGVVVVMLASTVMVWRRGARSSAKKGGDR
jgi:hypothetical protein